MFLSNHAPPYSTPRSIATSPWSRTFFLHRCYFSCVCHGPPDLTADFCLSFGAATIAALGSSLPLRSLGQPQGDLLIPHTLHRFLCTLILHFRFTADRHTTLCSRRCVTLSISLSPHSNSHIESRDTYISPPSSSFGLHFVIDP